MNTIEFATKAQIDKAIEIALRKAMRYFMFHTAQTIAKETKIDKKIIKGRLSKKINRKDLVGTITTFINPVPGVLLNSERTANGMVVGGKSFRGAFRVDLKRFRNNNLRPMMRVSSARRPLMQVRIPIAKNATEVIERIFDQTEMQFYNYLETELGKLLYGI